VRKKKALSLIELSIVLIIIGLLVAGVTGGASLIKNATLRGVMTDSRNYGVAINSFYVQYGALPGDYNKAVGTMIPAAGLGDLSGSIDYIGNLISSARYSESTLAWQHLKNSSIIDLAFTPTSALATAATDAGLDALSVGVNFPKSRVNGAGWFIDNQQIPASTGLVANWLFLTANLVDYATAPATGADFLPVASLTPSDAASIDDKIDDGVPDTGSVRSAINNGTNTATNCSSTGSTPNIYHSNTNQTRSCVLAFKIETS
jgi:prepilin-type N-terminal cleavage/methylation domain-containing protein